jgi:hypothetical protein
MTTWSRYRLLVLLALLPARPLFAQADSLYVGAFVRVKVVKLSPDWITGTVVQMQRTATCIAVRLDKTDAQGRGLYAFFTSVAAMEVDRRTNQGYRLVGTPNAEHAEWVDWPAEQIALIAKRCQR